ncbi:MAG: hypothetical protein FWD16_06510 [Clostridia bacterium]|nr:hypothetical protein [Clostridia bacterium]
MPELPDLEVYKGNVFDRLSSKKLVGIGVFNFNKVTAPQAFLLEQLHGRCLQSIDRVGKELFFDFGEDRVIAAHLMLNGVMSVVGHAVVDSVKFKVFSLAFEKETLVFADRGGLCTIRYKPPKGSAPDAFDEKFTLDYFLKTAHKKPLINIKAFLIDQKIVKGIGNAYADEILWEARVSPRSLTGKIPDDVLTVLYHAIDTVLKNAVARIKQISPDIISGEERSFLNVHTKTRIESPTGHRIIVDRIVSKITYFTEEQAVY